MADIFGNNRRSNEKALDPADFDGDQLVGTIAEKPKAISADGRKRWVIRFVEYPGRPYYVGVQQLTGIARMLGRDDEQYVGKRVALYVKTDVENPTTGGYVSKFYPMEPAEWAAAIAEYEAAQQPQEPVKVTTQAKRGKR